MLKNLYPNISVTKYFFGTSFHTSLHKSEISNFQVGIVGIFYLRLGFVLERMRIESSADIRLFLLELELK